MSGLLKNYGSHYRDVLNIAEQKPGWKDPIGKSDVIKAEIVHSVREEMAEKLSDVVLRRTNLGSGNNPGEQSLEICSAVMNCPR